MSTSGPQWVSGSELGIEFPTTIAALLAGGADFLTRAMQAAGALAPDNAVERVALQQEFFGGGMGRKLLLTVDYAQAAPGLHRELFVKFPRDFGDPLRALFAPLMQPEVRFALLSRRAGFPIAVPKCYFADYDPASTSGILISERIGYGRGAIEPAHDKCLDYTLASPLGHYQALIRVLARLAGSHQAGKLGAEVARQFPFDANNIDIGSRIPYSPVQLDAKLAKLEEFAARAAALFPAQLRAPQFLGEFARGARCVLERESAIRSYLNHFADGIALCHWNANLDNAWFWRDASGRIDAGLLDWGSVAQMNVAQAIYGLTCAAECDFLTKHRRELIALFVTEYRAAGGPALEPAEILKQYRLAVAVLGIAWILDAPSIVERELPAIYEIRERSDPRLRDNFLARAQLQLLMVFLNEWRDEKIGDALLSFG